MLRFVVTFGLALGLGASTVALAEDKDQKDKAKDLVGTYQMTGAEEAGQKAPKDKYDGNIVEITRDRIVVVDKNKKQVYVCTYQLDTSKTPCGITMTSEIAPNKGETVKGMIEKKGDAVRLVYSLSGEAPKKFETEGKGQILVEMKKMNDK